MHLDGLQSKVDRTLGLAEPLVGPLSTDFGQGVDRWVLILDLIVCHLYTSVWPAGWALLVSVTQDGILCVFLLHPLRVFFLF
jgi:hypothetical protein